MLVKHWLYLTVTKNSPTQQKRGRILNKESDTILNRVICRADGIVTTESGVQQICKLERIAPGKMCTQMRSPCSWYWYLQAYMYQLLALWLVKNLCKSLLHSSTCVPPLPVLLKSRRHCFTPESLSVEVSARTVRSTYRALRCLSFSTER